MIMEQCIIIQDHTKKSPLRTHDIIKIANMVSQILMVDIEQTVGRVVIERQSAQS